MSWERNVIPFPSPKKATFFCLWVKRYKLYLSFRTWVISNFLQLWTRASCHGTQIFTPLESSSQLSLPGWRYLSPLQWGLSAGTRQQHGGLWKGIGYLVLMLSSPLCHSRSGEPFTDHIWPVGHRLPNLVLRNLGKPTGLNIPQPSSVGFSGLTPSKGFRGIWGRHFNWNLVKCSSANLDKGTRTHLEETCWTTETQLALKNVLMLYTCQRRDSDSIGFANLDRELSGYLAAIFFVDLCICSEVFLF